MIRHCGCRDLCECGHLRMEHGPAPMGRQDITPCWHKAKDPDPKLKRNRKAWDAAWEEWGKKNCKCQEFVPKSKSLS